MYFLPPHNIVINTLFPQEPRRNLWLNSGLSAQLCFNNYCSNWTTLHHVRLRSTETVFIIKWYLIDTIMIIHWIYQESIKLEMKTEMIPVHVHCTVSFPSWYGTKQCLRLHLPTCKNGGGFRRSKNTWASRGDKSEVHNSKARYHHAHYH